MAITIKNDREIGKMREAGHVVGIVHQRVEAAIAPGVTTQDLDDIARDTFAEFGAGSSFLGHHGFTGRICASVNEEIVHGIPGKRVLRDGDIISVDVGAIVGATTATPPGPIRSATVSRMPERCSTIPRSRSMSVSPRRWPAIDWAPSATPSKTYRARPWVRAWS